MSYEFAKKEIGDYRITILQDEYSGCPCLEWDLVGVYLWEYGNRANDGMLSSYCNWEKIFGSYDNGNHSLEDALKELVCKYVSQKKIIKYINSKWHCDNLRLRYDNSDRMWYLEEYSKCGFDKGKWYEVDRYSPYDLKYRDYRDELCDNLEESDFKELLNDCNDIVFYEWSSTGYSQGDYVEGVAYCDKELFKNRVDTNTRKWKKRSLDFFKEEVKDISIWMWGDVKRFTLEQKVPFTKTYEDGTSEPSFEWKQIDSGCGEYYEDADDLIEEVIKEHELQPKEVA